MKPSKPHKPSCIYCRRTCEKYQVANNEIRIEEYETIAAACEFYTRILIIKT